jgi:superoxide dismutase, Fe-Mn family
MDKLFNNEAKNIIKKTLGISEGEDTQALKEAYAAQAKKFDIKTDFLSQANIENHKELYQDYIEKFSLTSAKLDTADKDANSNHSDFRSIKNDETFNMNGAYLHELYFSNIADGSSRINMDSLSYMRLTRDFGSFDNWQKDFMACALSTRCGWVVTYLNTYTQTYMNCAIDLHSENVPVGMYPVVVVDMWQHAYYKDYLKDAKTYLVAMMKQLRWPVIEKRIEKADKILQVLRER